ncbi:hypothetical protein Bbelb_358450 [Branchiostoma belcheri]|nr:hypothetical protein Bbelb_358450 [Branchiostoma belcheri]
MRFLEIAAVFVCVVVGQPGRAPVWKCDLSISRPDDYGIRLPAEQSTFDGQKNSVCNFPLGVENGNIRDTQMLTHFAHPGYEPWKGRLNGNGAWWAENSTLVKYLQINFGTERHVTGIKTQGFEDGWVETFQIETATTGGMLFLPRNFTGNTDNNTVVQNDFNLVIKTRYIKVVNFTGNTDNNTVVQNNFNPVIKTRYIKIVVETYHVAAKMRIELLGCDDNDDCQSNPCQNGGTCVDGLDSYSCNCADSFSGDTCEEKLTTVEIPTTAPLSTTSSITTASQTTGPPDAPTSQVPTVTTSTNIPTTLDLPITRPGTASKTTSVSSKTTAISGETGASNDVSTQHTTVHSTEKHSTDSARFTVDSGFTDHVSTPEFIMEDSTAATTSNKPKDNKPAVSGALIGVIVGGICVGLIVIALLLVITALLHKRYRNASRVKPREDFPLQLQKAE